MPEVIIEPAKGLEEEAKHFVKLMRLLALEYFPSLLGEKFKGFFKTAFMKEGNLFSHKHVVFAKYEGKIAGMLLSYS